MLAPTYNALIQRIHDLESEIDRIRRQEREQAIRELKWQWQTTFDAVGASICVLDTDWNILQCNRTTHTLLDKPTDEIIGRKCFELVHGTQVPPAECPVYRLAQTKQREIEILQFRDRWIEVAVDPILDENGDLKGIVHIISDITEHKAAVDSIRKGESTLRSIFRAAPIGIGMVMDRVIWQVNDRLCEMTGYSSADLLGQSARLMYATDEDYDHVGRVKYAQIALQGSGTVEARWRRKSGEIIDVLLSSAPLNNNDLSEGVTFTALDITERKRMEEELRRSESRFRGFAELLPQTVFEMAEDGRLTFINNNALRIFGYTRREFEKGLYALDMIAPTHRQQAHAMINDLLQGKKIIQGQGRRYTALRKDGSTFPVLIYSSVNMGEQNAKGIRGLIIDISEQEKLARERDKLEEQYIQAQKMEAVGRLAGGVAHDLNNMLSPILGYGELLLDTMPDEAPNRRAIEQIHEAGLRAKDLVRQLLAFSRKQALAIQSVNLCRVLAGFESLLNRMLRDDIKIELKFGAEVPDILADSGQIEQVIMNLAVNAQDAMPEGGTITIAVDVVDLDVDDSRLQETATVGRHVVLTFSDTGHGMDAKTQERIFDPFFTTKGLGKGTGLGLATVYGIIKQHNGSIRVSSNPGKGAMFWIYLPIATSESKPAPAKVTSPEALFGTETVLIVEDNQAVRGLTESILSKFGYKTTAVGGGRECLALLAQQPHFDLLFTDVVLEDINGKELYKLVRELCPDIKVLFMSGYTDDVIVHHGILEEGIAFIQKPFAVDELLKKVRQVLEEE